MAYEPLHHKYRPQTFAELVGQEAIAATLTNALRQRKIAPAYLFTGARGTGKTSSARIFAKSLNCLKSEKPTEKPCGKCDVCQQIARGGALDVIEIDAASNTGVDNIRELIERAQFAPVQCRYKVYVVDECLTGDSLVLTQDGLVRLDDPNLQGKQALSYNEASESWEFKRILRWLDQGEREILEIQTPYRKIRCTGNHLIRTDQGWIAARDVSEGMRILSPVPVAAELPFTNLAQTGGFGGLHGVTNSKAIAMVKSFTASTMSLSKPNLYDPFVNVDAERNWTFHHFFNKKERGLVVSKPIGNGIPIKRTTEFGSLELKSSLLKQVLCHLSYWVSFMERCWEMAPLAIQTPAADFPEFHGRMGSHSKPGWNIRQTVSNCSNQSLGSQQIVGMEQPRFVAVLSAILSLQKSLTALSLMGNERLCRSSGYLKSVQKDSLGGTWTMALSALVHKVALKFNSIQKVIQQQKTTSLLNGSGDWAIPSRFEAIPDRGLEGSTSTLLWEQRSQGVGYQTFTSTQSHQWTTSLETVVSVRPAGVERVYDIEVEDNHNFVANGLLVHNCHMLSAAAFNALLKTLEEPPDRVVFVLATTDPQRVLPTIISRCQRFDFRRIPLEAMVKHLGAIAHQEAIGITEDAIQLVAQISQGGLRDAESLLDQLSLLDGEVTTERVWDLVGAVPERDLLHLVQAIAQDHPATVLDEVRHLMDRGREPLTVLQNLTSFYRDLLIAKTTPERGDLVAITPPTWTELCQFAATLPIGVILQGQKWLQESEARIKHTTQPRLWLEVTLMGLLPSAVTAQAAPIPTVRQERSPTTTPVPATPPATTSTPVTTPTPVTSAKPAAVPSAPVTPAAKPEPAAPESLPAPATVSTPAPPPPEPAPQNTNDIWQEVLALVQPASTGILLRQQCRLLAFDGKEARIGVNSPQLLKMAKSKQPNIEAAFVKLCNQSVRVTLEVASGDVPPAPTAPANAPPQAAPEMTRSAPPVVEAPPRPVASAAPIPVQQPVQQSDRPSASAPAVEVAAPASSPLELTAPSRPQPAWQEEDEVLRAAKSLAQMFNGQIVDLGDEASVEQLLEEAANQTAATLDVEGAEEDDDDLPF